MTAHLSPAARSCARFSSERQNERSIEDQVRRCRDYIAQQGGDATSAQVFPAVTGIDSSPAMVTAARRHHPELTFRVADGQDFVLDEPVHAVFSYCALQWMNRDPAAVIRNVFRALLPGGRFVAELRGKGNAQAVTDALEGALGAYVPDPGSRNPWFYPTLGEYACLVEQPGFTVWSADWDQVEVPLPGGEQGLRYWLLTYAHAYLVGLSDADRDAVIGQVESQLRADHYRGDRWVIELHPLRVIAHKAS